MGCLVAGGFNPLAWELKYRFALSVALTFTLVVSFVGSYVWDLEVE